MEALKALGYMGLVAASILILYAIYTSSNEINLFQ